MHLVTAWASVALLGAAELDVVAAVDDVFAAVDDVFAAVDDVDVFELLPQPAASRPTAAATDNINDGFLLIGPSFASARKSSARPATLTAIVHGEQGVLAIGPLHGVRAIWLARLKRL